MSTHHAPATWTCLHHDTAYAPRADEAGHARERATRGRRLWALRDTRERPRGRPQPPHPETCHACCTTRDSSRLYSQKYHPNRGPLFNLSREILTGVTRLVMGMLPVPVVAGCATMRSTTGMSSPTTSAKTVCPRPHSGWSARATKKAGPLAPPGVSATVRGTYGTAEAGARTQYVRYVAPWGQAALRLWSVQYAGGWSRHPTEGGVRVSSVWQGVEAYVSA